MRTADLSARELGSRASSQRLPIRSDRPYFTHIQDGLSLGYRRGKSGGSFVARAYDREHGYRYEPLGKANDLIETVGMSFQQAQDAARLWYGRLASMDAGEVLDGRYTVADALTDYVSDLTKTKRKPQHRTTAVAKAHILPTLGNVDLSKLTHGKVKAWRDALAEAAPRIRTAYVKEAIHFVDHAGKKRTRYKATTQMQPQRFRIIQIDDADAMRKRQATANRVLTILKAALNYAKSESRRIATDTAWVDVKAFSKVDVPKVRFLTDAEVTALIAVCEPEFGNLVKSALLTGARYGELTALLVRDFNAKEGTLFISDSKNGESRYVQLNDEGIALFTEVADQRGLKERIFVKFNGTAWKSSEQQRPMDTACDAAEIKGVTFHILRHTYASHSVMNGMPIEVLASQLGHKDTRITMRHYAHLSQSFKRDMIRAKAPSFGLSSKLRPVLVNKAG